MNKEKIEELSLEEKIALLSGTNYMLTNQIFRLDISSVCHADGPHGLRKSLKGGKNLCSDIPSTVFPSAATTASSFNISVRFSIRKRSQSQWCRCYFRACFKH